MSRRTQQVASLVQALLGQQLTKLELPAMTTISKVEVTPDLKWAMVGITVLSKNKNDEKEILAHLSRNLFEMQGELIRNLKMKIVPRIRFVIDKQEEYAAHINTLLKKAKEDDES